MATVIIRIEDTADGGIHILCDAEGDTHESRAMRVAQKLLTVLPWQAAVEAEKTKE